METIKCKNCGWENPVNVRHCEKCNTIINTTISQHDDEPVKTHNSDNEAMKSPKRNGWVTFFLNFIVFINLCMTLLYVVLIFDTHSVWIRLILGLNAILSVVNILSSLLLKRWAKAGFYIFIISSLAWAFANAKVLGGLIIFSVLGVVVLWAILQIKKDGLTVWSQLKNNWNFQTDKRQYKLCSLFVGIILLLIVISFCIEGGRREELQIDSDLEEEFSEPLVEALDSIEIEKDDDIDEIALSFTPAESYSNDLRTYKLHGHVKRVRSVHISKTGDERDIEELSFRRNGDINFNDTGIIVKRNSDGRITEIEYDLGGRIFKYDVNGETISVADWDTSTTWEKYIVLDKYGTPKESNQYGEDGEDGGITGRYKYLYQKWDNKGNWVLRRVRYYDSYSGASYSEWNERREIEYY